MAQGRTMDVEIYAFTGTGANQDITHNLGTIPDFVWITATESGMTEKYVASKTAAKVVLFCTAKTGEVVIGRFVG